MTLGLHLSRPVARAMTVYELARLKRWIVRVKLFPTVISVAFALLFRAICSLGI